MSDKSKDGNTSQKDEPKKGSGIGKAIVKSLILSAILPGADIFVE